MRIMVGIAHPKQVHFWKNILNNLEKNEHEVKIVAREKDITLYLLNVYRFKYEIIGKNYKGLMRKAYGLLESDFKAFKVAGNFKPDIFLAGSPALAHVSKIIGKPHIGFIDTEHAGIAYWLTYPFSDVICTPSCFKKEISSMKHVTFNGYMELAYLHPNYFKPDPSVLYDLGLSKGDKFVIIRLVSWEATHDIHSRGFSEDFLEKAIKSLKEYGHVFITSEQKLNRNLEKYKMQIPPEKLHSALYYASLYFGEGGTTAVEAALLGTPSVHVEAFKTKSGEVVDATQIHGNFDELANKYWMLYTFSDPNKALNKALEMLQDKNAKKEMRERREKLLREKIDVTAFITDFIENYPESFYEYIQGKGYEGRKGQ